MSVFAAAVVSLTALSGSAQAGDKVTRSASAAPTAQAPAEAEPPTGPLQLVVSLRKQRVDVYRGLTRVASSRVSTGKPGHTTPTGVYSILDKRRWHRSNIYSQAPMPYMQRITWSGIALHAGRVPNRPASHGCIRLPAKFAKELFRKTHRGAHVVIVRDEAAPREISHPMLFQPSPPGSLVSGMDDGALRMASLAAVDVEAGMAQLAYARRSRKPLRILITWRTGRDRMKDVQRLLNTLGHEAGEVDGYFGGDTARAVKSWQEANGYRPTGMIDDALIGALHRAAGTPRILRGHLYVRQGYRDIYDAPIHLRAPNVAIGTHVYLAGDFADGDTSVDWQVLEADDGDISAEEVFDRMELPDDVRHKISRMLTPGSSLIVSDKGIGKETTRGTDFVVQTR